VYPAAYEEVDIGHLSARHDLLAGDYVLGPRFEAPPGVPQRKMKKYT